MSRRGRLTAVLCWLPVLAAVVALFVVPSSTVAAGGATLHVRPGSDTYGGQEVIFSGNIGVRGIKRIHLQRRGAPDAAWADVPDPRPGPHKGDIVTEHTKADGSFEFAFPSPAMSGCYFRVVSGRLETPQHQFLTIHQDAEISMTGAAVVNVPFRLAVDTVSVKQGKPTKPILAGRTVTLQERDVAGEWTTLTTGLVGRDGQVGFDQTRTSPGTVVYRVRLENWNEGGDQIGWFPSLPFSVTVASARVGGR